MEQQIFLHTSVLITHLFFTTTPLSATIKCALYAQVCTQFSLAPADRLASMPGR